MRPLALKLVGDTLYLRAAARRGPLTEHHRLALTGFQVGQLSVALARSPPKALQSKMRRETLSLMRLIARDLGYRAKVTRMHRDGWVTVIFTLVQ